MAYELFMLLKPGTAPVSFDLLPLWSLLIETAIPPANANSTSVTRRSWALGHALVEYWTQDLAIEQLRDRFEAYLQQV